MPNGASTLFNSQAFNLAWIGEDFYAGYYSKYGCHFVGALIGLLFKGGIPSYNQTIMKAIGLAVVLIGLLNAFQTQNMLLLIFSLAIGSLLEMMKIETGLETWVTG